MHFDAQPTPTRRFCRETKSGWHLHEHYLLPAGHRLAFDTIGERKGVTSVVTLCALDHVGCVLEDVLLPPFAAVRVEVLARRRATVTEEAVSEQHAQEVTRATVGQWVRRAASEYCLYQGVGALELAQRALPCGFVRTFIRTAAGAIGDRVPHARIMEALANGFAVSDEMAHLGHPLVVLLGDRRAYVEADVSLVSLLVPQREMPAKAGPEALAA